MRNLFRKPYSKVLVAPKGQNLPKVWFLSIVERFSPYLTGLFVYSTSIWKQSHNKRVRLDLQFLILLLASKSEKLHKMKGMWILKYLDVRSHFFSTTSLFSNRMASITKVTFFQLWSFVFSHHFEPWDRMLLVKTIQKTVLTLICFLIQTLLNSQKWAAILSA